MNKLIISFIILILLFIYNLNKFKDNFSPTSVACDYEKYVYGSRFNEDTDFCEKIFTQDDCNENPKCIFTKNKFKNEAKCINLEKYNDGMTQDIENNLDTDYNFLISCQEANNKLNNLNNRNIYIPKYKLSPHIKANTDEKSNCFYHYDNDNYNDYIKPCENELQQIITNEHFPEDYRELPLPDGNEEIEIDNVTNINDYVILLIENNGKTQLIDMIQPKLSELIIKKPITTQAQQQTTHTQQSTKFITHYLNKSEDEIDKFIKEKLTEIKNEGYYSMTDNFNYYDYYLGTYKINYESTESSDEDKKNFLNYKKLLYILLSLEENKNGEYVYQEGDNIGIKVEDFDVSNIVFMFDLFYFVNKYYITIKINPSTQVMSSSQFMSSSQTFNIFEYIDISSWNVSNVTNMVYMFDGCTNFNEDLSNWNVSNVTNMGFMFYECELWNNGGEPLGEIWDNKLKDLELEKREEIFYETKFILDGVGYQSYDENGLIERSTTHTQQPTTQAPQPTTNSGINTYIVDYQNYKERIEKIKSNVPGQLKIYYRIKPKVPNDDCKINYDIFLVFKSKINPPPDKLDDYKNVLYNFLKNDNPSLKYNDFVILKDNNSNDCIIIFKNKDFIYDYIYNKNEQIDEFGNQEQYKTYLEGFDYIEDNSDIFDDENNCYKDLICHKYNDCCKNIFHRQNGFIERKNLFMTANEIKEKFNINILNKFKQTQELPPAKSGIFVQTPENPFPNPAFSINPNKVEF